MASFSKEVCAGTCEEFNDIFEYLDDFHESDWSKSEESDDVSDTDEEITDVTIGLTKTRRDLKYLDAHIVMVESELDSDKKFKCSACNKEFKSKQGCKSHLVNVHKILGPEDMPVNIESVDKNKTTTGRKKREETLPVPKYTLDDTMIDAKDLVYESSYKI
ncbi:uncharacterized protein LOC144356722 [Saccoglossus kowalevskii]